MSNNKVNNKLDFRNVKTTQFDPGQVNKMSFSELQSALRVYGTNAVLSDAYTHFVQDLDVNSNPISVTYYQATDPARDRLNFASDSAGSLAGTYITLQDFITKKLYVFYYVVSGIGTAPGVGDVEIPVVINANDTSALVAYSTREAIKGTEEFIVIDSNLLANYVDVEYLQFGETDLINVGTTGFTSTRTNEGKSFKVGEIEIEYNGSGDPIYNGNVLKGLKFNPFSASFDISNTPESLPETLIFDQNTATIMYIGVAEYGAQTTESKWKIQRIDTSTGVEIRNASTTYNQIWDDREILSYE